MIQENLAGTIRCIVIDPCYHTGTAFDPRGDGAGHFILQLANLRQTTLSKGQKDSSLGSSKVALPPVLGHFLAPGDLSCLL